MIILLPWKMKYLIFFSTVFIQWSITMTLGISNQFYQFFTSSINLRRTGRTYMEEKKV